MKRTLFNITDLKKLTVKSFSSKLAFAFLFFSFCYAEPIHSKNDSQTTTTKDLALAKCQLAIEYFSQQEKEKAFSCFLEALDACPQEKQVDRDEQEAKIYEQALSIYINDAGLNPLEIADKIHAQYASVYETNKNYYSLGFLLAAGYANKGTYEEFFKIFFESYRHQKEHFLSYKSKALLYIKLFERSTNEEERSFRRQKILENLQKAIDLQPADTSLYRTFLSFTEEKEKRKILHVFLKKIVDNSIVISRLDIPYYVEMAIAFEEFKLARNFIERAKEWYSYSRVVAVAEMRLEEYLKK